VGVAQAPPTLPPGEMKISGRNATCQLTPCLTTGRFQEAIDDLTEATRIDPSFEDAKIYLHQAIEDRSNTKATEK